jgi:hypothetical protein
MNDRQIESFLRRAPRPPAPAQLQEKLLADVHLPSPRDAMAAPVIIAPRWRRWFPAISVGALFLGCLIVLGVQTRGLFDLRRANLELRATTANLEQLREENAELQRLRTGSQGVDQQRSDHEELLRLRAEVSRLRASAEELTRLRAENQRLQAERSAAAMKAGVVSEEDPLKEAREKAERIRCINHIKQIGLAARIWANDHPTDDRRDLLPADFLTMSEELNTPGVLTCSADKARTPAKNWQEFDGSSVSYELLSPGVDSRETSVVYVRCRIHNNAGLVDGSAQMFDEHVSGIQKVDGKFKLVRLQSVVPKPTTQP